MIIKNKIEKELLKNGIFLTKKYYLESAEKIEDGNFNKIGRITDKKEVAVIETNNIILAKTLVNETFNKIGIDFKITENDIESLDLYSSWEQVYRIKIYKINYLLLKRGLLWIM